MALTDLRDEPARGDKATGTQPRQDEPLPTNIAPETTSLAPTLPKPGNVSPPTESRPRDHVLG